MCQAAGYWLGENLNVALDAMDFVDCYDRWITGFVRADAGTEYALSSSDLNALHEELAQCINSHLSATDTHPARWGFKEPRSMFLLPCFSAVAPGFKFIHVLRDGRDIALSANQNQLNKHGEALLPARGEMCTDAERSIQMWSAANERAADYAERALAGRYLRLRFEDLCRDSERTTKQILTFLDAPESMCQTLSEGIQTPASLGRWRALEPERRESLTLAGANALKRFGYL